MNGTIILDRKVFQVICPKTQERVIKIKGWKSVGDWLGTYSIASKNRKFKSFEEARKIVRQLNFKNFKEWEEYKKKESYPINLPKKPEVVYKNKGWISMRNWLGIEFKSFEDARKFIRTLNLKSTSEWNDYKKNKHFPADIPKKPNDVYAKEGWKGIGDWLGTGKLATSKIEYKSFEEARQIIRKLNLKTIEEWKEFKKDGAFPFDIPKKPHDMYKNHGWVSYYDWLGAKQIPSRFKKFKLFADARKFVRQLNLKSAKEWFNYTKQKDFPSDLPKNPKSVYAKDGWISYGDWLGTGTVSTRNRKYRSFKDAREFVIKLNLKSIKEWDNFKNNKNFPPDMPKKPDLVYAKDGWISYGDWLGT